jgi:RHS repeat-associated protein
MGSAFPVPLAATISSSLLMSSAQPQASSVTTDAAFHNGIIRWYDPVTGRWLSNDPIGISGGLNQYVFCGDNPINAADPFGFVQWKKLGSATWGIVGNGLGVASGVLVGLIPEPTMATKVFAGVVVAKSGFGLGLDLRNAWHAIKDDPCSEQLPSSMANYLAATVAPGNETAQRVSDIVDLSVDLGFMRTVSLSVRTAPGLYQVGRGPIGPMVRLAGITDPTDLGRLASIYSVVDYGRIAYQNAVPMAVTSP